jgi:uncharacterized protein YecE (DUF72 family)
MKQAKLAKRMLGVVAFGLFVSGVTVWPAVPELKAAVSLIWGAAEAASVLHGFVLKAVEGLETVTAEYPFMLYAHDWLAFAHIVLAILFAGAMRDPVRNVWIVQCGLIMCALVPVLAGICIPVRGLPLCWFWLDFAFAPAAALPLWLALRDIRRAEAGPDTESKRDAPVNPQLHIGACSWKFDAWRGLVYSGEPSDYLTEYAQHFDCVEIDQWYWSLFGADKVSLPQPKAVAGYAQSVPAGFRFGVKLPDALTLTHLRPANKADPLVPNPHFLSPDLLGTFMGLLEPMRDKLGPLMLQFGYLNRQMMGSQAEFLDRLDHFVKPLPGGYQWCVEIRNPNWLNDDHFLWLRERMKPSAV